MKILEKVEEEGMLRLLIDSNEETTFFLLKVYLEKNSDVEIVGVYKEHHLVQKTEFVLKVKKGNPVDVLKKSLKEIKKDLESKKVK